jgi:hypothetical protein
VAISSVEFRLLMALEHHPGARPRPPARHGAGREAHLFDRAVDNQVSRLRRKIEVDSRNPQVIQTVWGGGYMLAADVRRVPAPTRRAVLTRPARTCGRVRCARVMGAAGAGAVAGQGISAALLSRAQYREEQVTHALAIKLVMASRGICRRLPVMDRRGPTADATAPARGAARAATEHVDQFACNPSTSPARHGQRLSHMLSNRI